jgi:hypothetical protein
MALNSNHTFEDLAGVKCSIIEKNIGAERVAFLKDLLEFNGYKVVVEKSPAAKVAPPKPVPAPTPAAPTPAAPTPAASTPAAPATPPAPSAPSAPETFTLGVTDYLFNPMHALYGKELKTPAGRIVDMAYWKQEIAEPKEGELYWKGPLSKDIN